ncbi:MAG: adenylate kinase [Proteobacteria bacterium]|nr:adenylate kinase [Pseudomonadota bacterium]MBS0464846.1 adenylate kinase [Pseudomonadota bacterium]
MRLVLLGAPGSGKGTQAARLRDHFGVPHISTGELLRAAVRAGTPIGLKAKAVMDAGGLVSDEIVLTILEERLSAGDTGAGYILDGYPRNLSQANALDVLLARLAQPVERAIQLDVDNELLIARLAGRALAEGRADDNPESVRKRLEVYDAQTAPVIDYYRHQQKLTSVDGVGAMEEVFERIVEALGNRFA